MVTTAKMSLLEIVAHKVKWYLVEMRSEDLIAVYWETISSPNEDYYRNVMVF